MFVTQWLRVRLFVVLLAARQELPPVPPASTQKEMRPTACCPMGSTPIAPRRSQKKEVPQEPLRPCLRVRERTQVCVTPRRVVVARPASSTNLGLVLKLAEKKSLMNGPQFGVTTRTAKTMQMQKVCSFAPSARGVSTRGELRSRAVPVGQRHTPDINSQIYRHHTLARYQRQCIVSTDSQNKRTIGEARGASCRFACPALRCLFTPKMPLLLTGACSPQKRRFAQEAPAHHTGACALQRWMYTSKVPTHISGAYSPQMRLYTSQPPAHTRDALLLDGRLYSPGMRAHLRAAGSRERRPHISGELVRLGNAGAPQRYVYYRQATAYPRGNFTPQRYLYAADMPAHPRGDGAHDRRIDTTEVPAHGGAPAPQRLQSTRQAPTRARVASIPCRWLYARHIPVRSRDGSALQRCLYTRFVAVHFEGSSTPVSD